jgi:F-type H+-transporting ATPase subunit b
LDELEAKKQEAEKVLAQYNERLSLLDQEAEKIKSSYIEQGKEAQARILEQAKASVAKLEANAHRQIETAFERARAELQGVILEKAIEKAEAKIRENISAEDQDRLVDDYLEKVVA